MCGISGIINFSKEEVSRELLENINEQISHRGPDDKGIFIDKFVGLGHRRLSIIDLNNGQQPMSNARQDITVVFNGEIYNYCELRKLLEDKGYNFQTKCDTEILLYLYEEYQEKCIQHLNGMFAFAIYDKKNQTVLIARDRAGQKPLFYFNNQNSFVFASELQALKQHSKMPKDINYQSTHDYFSLQYIPAPNTIYNNVYKLDPAHYLKIDLRTSQIEKKKYWTLDYSKKTNLSYSDAKDKLSELLKDSVEKRLQSDVPYGAFLSGGIDSSIISGLMSEIVNDEIKLFTIGFETKQYDERSFADLAVCEFSKRNNKIKHWTKVVTPDDFDIVKNLSKHYGEPYSDASMLPTYLLSEFTKEKVTVALSGDGADELFAGYDRYLVMKYMKQINKLPYGLRKPLFASIAKILPNAQDERGKLGKIQRILKICASRKNEQYLNVINRFPENSKQGVYGNLLQQENLKPTNNIFEELLSATSANDEVEKISELDFNSYLYGDILTKVDIASMATSLEVRSPFMDHRVIEFAASLPFEFKLNKSNQKHILKDAFSNMLPQQLTNRNKMGFGVPISFWFRNQWKDILTEHLLDGQGITEGFFSKPVLEKMITNHIAAKEDNSYQLWSLLNFELFLNL